MTKKRDAVFEYQHHSLFLIIIGLGSCVTVDPSSQIDISANLVEQRTGHRPHWQAPWDDQPPLWNGDSILDLETAVAISLRNNRILRAELEMIGQANADLVQAGLLQNPVINLMMMFPDGGGRSMLRSAGWPMQALSDLWLIPAKQEAAQHELQRTILNLTQRAIDTAAETKKSMPAFSIFNEPSN